jgi:hypothetical protein
MTPKPESEIVEASQKSHWGASTRKPPESVSLVKRYDSIGSAPACQLSGTVETRGRGTFDWGV